MSQNDFDRIVFAEGLRAIFIALECQEIVDSNNNTGKINNNSCTDLKSALQFSVKKVVLKLEGCNGVRSIVDLPHVLVYELLHCLDPNDLGIVSCVSNLLNGLATDNIGLKDFYCKRWGAPLGPALPPPGSWMELFVERELRSKSLGTGLPGCHLSPNRLGCGLIEEREGCPNPLLSTSSPLPLWRPSLLLSRCGQPTAASPAADPKPSDLSPLLAPSRFKTEPKEPTFTPITTVATHEGIPMDQQRLIFAVKQLEDGGRSYGFRDDMDLMSCMHEMILVASGRWRGC